MLLALRDAAHNARAALGSDATLPADAPLTSERLRMSGNFLFFLSKKQKTKKAKEIIFFLIIYMQFLDFSVGSFRKIFNWQSCGKPGQLSSKRQLLRI